MNIKVVVLIILISFIALLLFFLLLFRRVSDEKEATPSPASTPLQIIPQDIRAAPTFAPSEGMGIDVLSEPIQKSISEIAKIESSLPFKKTVLLSTGDEADILIPKRSSFSNKWTLTIYIDGLNFNIHPQEPEYDKIRTSFLEAANIAFDWIREGGADPTKMYINWGDRAFIQEKAEVWLKK